MSELTTPLPSGFRQRWGRDAVSTGNIALILSSITIVLVIVVGDIHDTAPCWRSALVTALWESAAFSVIAALGAGVVAILAGLLTLRVRAIASGVLPVLISLTFIDAALRSRATSMIDSSAVAQLRTIDTAEVTYHGYTSGFGSIEELIREGLLDDRFRSTVAGYNFTVTAEANGYTAKATSASKYGCWDYFSTPDAVVRYSTDASRAPKGQSAQPVQ